LVFPKAVLVVWASLVALSGCEGLKERLFSPKVKVKCQVLEGRCKFTNEGDPGDACVRVKVHHELDGRDFVSLPVCSGPMKTNEVRWKGVEWEGVDPLRVCMGEELRLDFGKMCSAEVLEGDGR